jgi:hypothetical protein
MGQSIVLEVEGSGEVKGGGANLSVLRKMMREHFLIETQQMIAHVQDLLLVVMMIYVVGMSFVVAYFPYLLAGQALVGVWFWD